MQTATDIIDADQFCIYHNIEISFIHSLHQSGLIEIVVLEQKVFIKTDQLSQLEKLARLQYEMDINIEGIETIAHLLQKIDLLQNEIILHKNKLRFYEEK